MIVRYRYTLSKLSDSLYLKDSESFFRHLPTADEKILNLFNDFKTPATEYIDLVEQHERLSITNFKKIVFLEADHGERTNVLMDVVPVHLYDFYGQDFDTTLAELVKQT